MIAGLTGGIASGKTTVSAILKHAGAEIVDADAIAHAVVRKGLPAWHKIIAYFGKKVLLPNEEINRSCLADIIFRNPEHKETLNKIVHPFVFEEVEQQIQEVKRNKPLAPVIADVPLLIESGIHSDFSEIILVYVPEYLQLQRLMQRNRLSKDEAMLRIRSQMPIEEKKRFATIIVDNSGNIENTGILTMSVYQKLLQADKKA